MTDHLKPGERALEAIKKMENAVVEFKMPELPRTKKGHMKILTEEQYVEVSKSIYFVSFRIFIVCFRFLTGTRQNNTKRLFSGFGEA